MLTNITIRCILTVEITKRCLKSTKRCSERRGKFEYTKTNYKKWND